MDGYTLYSADPYGDWNQAAIENEGKDQAGQASEYLRAEHNTGEAPISTLRYKPAVTRVPMPPITSNPKPICQLKAGVIKRGNRLSIYKAAKTLRSRAIQLNPDSQTGKPPLRARYASQY